MGLFNILSKTKRIIKNDTPTDLQSLYMHDLSFHATRYEEWKMGQCISQGNINVDINGTVGKDTIQFSIIGNHNLNIDSKAIYHFSTSHILGDRIQYAKAAFFDEKDNNTPIVCHIFIKNNRLFCIRFAMSYPDRIIEFYSTQEDSNKTISQADGITEKDYKLTFLLGLMKIVTCDGHVDDEEMKTIMAHMYREGLDESDLQRVLINPDSFKHVIPQDKLWRLQHIRDAVMISMVDGDFHPNEYALCKQLAKSLGFKPEIVDKIREETNEMLGSYI